MWQYTEIDLKNPKTNRKNAGFTDEERSKFTELLDSGYIDTYRYFTRIKRAFIPGGRTGLRRARRMLGGGLIISVFPRA